MFTAALIFTLAFAIWYTTGVYLYKHSGMQELDISTGILDPNQRKGYKVVRFFNTLMRGLMGPIPFLMERDGTYIGAFWHWATSDMGTYAKSKGSHLQILEDGQLKAEWNKPPAPIEMEFLKLNLEPEPLDNQEELGTSPIQGRLIPDEEIGGLIEGAPGKTVMAPFRIVKPLAAPVVEEHSNSAPTILISTRSSAKKTGVKRIPAKRKSNVKKRK